MYQKLFPWYPNAMKLYPCWSGIMMKTFKYGDATVSSCRVENNFNNIKNRVFNGDNLPMRVDNFLEKLVSYYNGDYLLLQSSDSIVTTNTNIDENLGSYLDTSNYTNNYNSQTVSSNKSIINEHHLNDQELETDCTDEGFYIGHTINNSNQELYNKNVIQIEEDQDMECTEKRKTSTGTILNNEFNTNICLSIKTEISQQIYIGVFFVIDLYTYLVVQLILCIVKKATENHVYVCYVLTSQKKITLKNSGKEK